MSQSRKSNEPQKNSGFGEPLKYESKLKPIAWFKNYWYYYKAPVIVISVFVIIAGWLIHDVLTAKEIDMRLYTITETELSTQACEPMQAVMQEYATDADGDGEVVLKTSYMRLAAEPADEMEAAAYQQIMTVMVDDNVTLLLIDEFVYNYLKNSDALDPLSVYGLEGMDEYRIRATDSFLVEDTKFADLLELYLVFRVRQVDTVDDPVVQARYDSSVKLAAAVAADTEQNP
ncbi:MAG: hypothetical protein E7463_11790 [Ruminococcaceae bacterium]|nr:hypothetical protein [Oscillospiraceae bacterium]